MRYARKVKVPYVSKGYEFAFSGRAQMGQDLLPFFYYLP